MPLRVFLLLLAILLVPRILRVLLQIVLLQVVLIHLLHLQLRLLLAPIVLEPPCSFAAMPGISETGSTEWMARAAAGCDRTELGPFDDPRRPTTRLYGSVWVEDKQFPPPKSTRPEPGGPACCLHWNGYGSSVTAKQLLPQGMLLDAGSVIKWDLGQQSQRAGGVMGEICAARGGGGD